MQYTTALLQAQSLCFHHEHKVQLCDINLSINQAEIWSILGPNGAGKTTLLKLLCGLLKPTDGQVYLNNRPLQQFDLSERATMMAVVDQLSPSDIPLCVQDYVSLGKIARRYSRDILSLEALLKRLSLLPLRYQPIAKLSGGERQRAHIARALYQQPQILFLDEPTNHLDPAFGYELLGWLKTLGITLVMVLHDLNLAKHFSTHTLLLKRGKSIAFGDNQQVLKSQQLSPLFNISVLELAHPNDVAKPGFIVYEAQ